MAQVERTLPERDPFLAAVKIREPGPEPELPLLTVVVREQPPGDGERHVVEVLLDGRPMGLLPATGVRWEMRPGRFGKLSIDLLAPRAEVTADV